MPKGCVAVRIPICLKKKEKAPCQKQKCTNPSMVAMQPIHCTVAAATVLAFCVPRWGLPVNPHMRLSPVQAGLRPKLDPKTQRATLLFPVTSQGCFPSAH